MKFHKMTELPKESINSNEFSESVIVFEFYDLHGKTHVHQDIGWYDFIDKEWHVNGDESMELSCWAYFPNPPEQTKEWETATHYGYVH